MKDHIILIRDNSELSDKVEEYIKSLNKPYLIYYSKQEEEEKELPVILAPTAISEFCGEYGFSIFKTLYKK
jgi:hypothetical protein